MLGVNYRFDHAAKIQLSILQKLISGARGEEQAVAGFAGQDKVTCVVQRQLFPLPIKSVAMTVAFFSEVTKK